MELIDLFKLKYKYHKNETILLLKFTTIILKTLKKIQIENTNLDIKT